MTNTDSMNTARARWIGRRVEYRHSTNRQVQIVTGVIVDFTPAELLVRFDDDGGVMWISGDEIGGNLVVIDGEPAFEVGDPITWTPYFGPETRVGHIIAVDADALPSGVGAAEVRALDDGATFRVALDRIQHRAGIPAPDVTVDGGEPELEVGDPITWTAYFNNHVHTGFVHRLGKYDSHVVRDMDGNTFRVAADRIQHRDVPAAPSATFTGAGRGTGIRLEAVDGGVLVTAFDHNTGHEVDVKLPSSTLTALRTWLVDPV